MPERLLQLNVAALAAMSTLLLGMGQRDMGMPTVMLFVVVASFYFTDVLGRFQLNRLLSSLAAVVTTGFVLIEFFRSDRETQLLVLASLMSYLQMVLLFQKKCPRTYWQLITLSLLQVVVAAALSLGFEFGLLLVVFMFLALSAMVLLFVHQETAPFRVPQPALRTGPASASAIGTPWWPAAAPAATMRFSRQGTEDPGTRMLGWRLARHVVALGFGTLLLAVVLFFAVPRYGTTAWHGPIIAGPSQTGFSPELSLNEWSRIRESEDRVMRVSFVDQATGRPADVVGEPYFRGTVLTQYRNGRWTRNRTRNRQQSIPLPTAPVGANIVRQYVAMEPTQSAILFGVFPAYRLDRTPPEVRWDPQWEQVYRVDPKPRNPYHYVLGTTGIAHGYQTPFTPAERPMPPVDAADRLELADRLPGLAALAEEIVDDAGAGPDDRVAQAEALLAHFHTSGRYQYSLDLDPALRNVRLDPLEDFVTNHRTGHCEYFASALAQMLRAQGIPARVVNGYLGGEFNSLGNYYQVKQLHAHAWVEMYIEPRHLPDGVAFEPAIARAGAWMRLDPTPGAAEIATESDGLSVFDRFHEMVDYAQLLWNDYVLGLNSERQRESIYRPLARRIRETGRWALDPATWESLNPLQWFRGNWFDWRAALAVIVLCLAGIPLVRVLRPAVTRLCARLRQSRVVARRRRRMHVEFYQRLERLLARHGIRRVATQTHREFAAAATGQLAAEPDRRQVADTPRRVAEAFYRVRFGRQHLDNDELLALEHAMRRLETVLSGKA